MIYWIAGILLSYSLLASGPLEFSFSTRLAS